MATNRQLFLQHLGQTSPGPMMVEIESANGVFLYGPDGTRYIDLISGVSVSNTGHNHPKVVNSVKDQAERFLHLMVYGEIIQSPQVKYAVKLSGLLPNGLDVCYFVNSGSEAVEGGLKLAKRFTGRSRVVSFRNAYHGSTHGALSVQGSEIYRNAFRPLIPDTFLADFNDEKSLETINAQTACVIIEPVQGEAGVICPENDFLAKVRDRCNTTGSLLIFDEIQTGFGRLGELFALQKYRVVPDILLLAKALGGGMPLGAFISSREIMTSLSTDPVLGHITTFGGHPVCCAAGLAALNVIIDENLIQTCGAKSELFKKRLKHQLIKDVRGEGLLLAIELAGTENVKAAIKYAPEFGIIIDFFLFCDTALRLAPPLTINNDEIIFACDQIIKLLDYTLEKNDT